MERKLEELRLISPVGLAEPIYFEEGYEPRELFVLSEAINPENEYKVKEAWIPLERRDFEVTKKELINTTKYHNWTSWLTEELDNLFFESEEETIRETKKILEQLRVELPYEEWNYEIEATETYINDELRFYPTVHIIL